MDIEKMINVVCGLIKQVYGFDIQKASSITDGEIKDEILRRVMKGEKIKNVIKDCKAKYVREEIDFKDKSKKKPAARR